MEISSVIITHLLDLAISSSEKFMQLLAIDRNRTHRPAIAVKRTSQLNYTDSSCQTLTASSCTYTKAPFSTHVFRRR
jgi:hypothetical protein